MSEIASVMGKPAIVALAGQPNTGKSTVFNGLTGARQHVGNWPGKTVEQKSGRYVYLDQTYTVMDLPGTYSLSANSPEEVIARDYMVSGEPSALVVMIDASQLERSLYFLSEIAGLSIPTIIGLNMMDVAKEKGIHINVKALEKLLGVPVVEMVASKAIGMDTLKEALTQVIKKKTSVAAEGLFEIFKMSDRAIYKPTLEFLKTELAAIRYGDYAVEWLAVKCLERDRLVMETIKAQMSDPQYKVIVAQLEKVPYDKMTFASYRFKWIEKLISKSVNIASKEKKLLKRSWFDRLSTHRYLGQPLAFMMILLGFMLSMVICMPIMSVLSGQILPKVYQGTIQGLQNIGAPIWLISIMSEAVLPAAVMALIMILFVTSVLLIFGVMEDVGYLARVAFVFDRAMCKLGLHGKAIIPFMMSLGCNMAGITGSRVIDSLKQRRLAIVVSLVMPCLAMWGVISFVSAIFFGAYTPVVLLGLFLLTIVHMKITAKVFGKWIIGATEDFQGLVMELPPFHKPNWKSILKNTWYNTKNVAQKAFLLIVGISMVMWILSFSSTGHIEDSIIYSVGKTIEPISMFFGFDWRLFTAFIVSAMGKEASLGVLAMLFGQGGGVMSFTGTMVGSAVTYSQAGFQSAMANSVSTASALAFVTAFFFNVPCMAAIATIRIEAGSMKFTWQAVAYYMTVALLMGGIVYRVATLFL
ncbi:MAG: ferrous iron transport protein B [Clostridia bacterium]|nr:ferrous iron transport protein B [Clostridia bacterium]